MSISDFIGAYAEGWTVGDATKIIDATTPDYVLDDPNAGEISRDEFADYFQEWHQPWMNYAAAPAKVTSLTCRKLSSMKPRMVLPFGAGGKRLEPE
ncbi:MAG: nuclear transport factor 2 family protein [Alphaproteobacteria bacterium]|jgi:hypothetical protein